jgi:hypothetical protein
MGGSGGGGYTPPAPSSPCSRLAFRATLNSPQGPVIAGMQIGSVLDVVSSGQGVEARFNGQLAGAITGNYIAQLLNCLNKGFKYEAVVFALTGGQCVVDVGPK